APVGPGSDIPDEQTRQIELFGILTKFIALWDERIKQPPAHNLLSMLCHHESSRPDPPEEYLGNVTLLIVAGSHTSRHSITGGLLALNQYPEEYAKLRADPALIDTMVPEI